MQVMTPSELFTWNYCQKLSKNRLVDSSKDFLSGCTSNKSKLGFVKPTGLPEEAVKRFSEYAQS